MMRVASLVALSVLFACAADEGGGGDTDGGPAAGTARFFINVDVRTLCADDDGADQVRLAARRVGCWDPEVPCTVPSDPPFVYGTSRPCSEVTGAPLEWTLDVDRTGTYETQMQSFAGGTQVDGICLNDGEGYPARVDQMHLADAATILLGAGTDSGMCAP